MYNLARKLDDEDFQMRKKAQELEELLQTQDAAGCGERVRSPLGQETPGPLSSSGGGL